MRITKKVTVVASQTLRTQCFNWASKHSYYVWLDSNQYPASNAEFEWCLAVGVQDEIKISPSQLVNIKDLQAFVNSKKDWLFGYLSYDLKNAFECLKSTNSDYLQFPSLHFIQPQKILLYKEGALHFLYNHDAVNEISGDWQAIQNIQNLNPYKQRLNTETLNIQARISKEQYISRVEAILQHIQKGDVYELNYCFDYFAEQAYVDMASVFQNLNAMSLTPFAALWDTPQHAIASASMERFLKKKKQTLISQPIKGTAPRATNPEKDAILASNLASNPKERSENIMITDLVRNDFSRIARPNTVKVPELCKVYPYKQVQQMQSTVACKLPKSCDFTTILKATFPMGSMTGAPKIKALELIDLFENFKRGPYSGALGYITPTGDFDFNVLIRSVFYNKETNYLSVPIGSAITAQANALQEYDECQLKAHALRKVLQAL